MLNNGGIAEQMFDLAKLALDGENSIIPSATFLVRDETFFVVNQ